MVSVMSLAVPILLSAVLVFIASSILHMVLPVHRNDRRKLAAEDRVLEALRGFNIPPGDYVAPYAGSAEAMKDPQFVERMKKGPIVLLTVAPGGSISLASNLISWFIYSIIVSIFAGTSQDVRSDQLRTTSTSSASPVARRSLAMRWRFRRTPSGSNAAGARRSKTWSTASCTGF